MLVQASQPYGFTDVPAFGRMVPLAAEGTAKPLRGRMRRTFGDGLELIEHASEDGFES
jgi:hypothetical protein